MFFTLWQQEKGNTEELELLEQYSADEALDNFSDIRSEEGYWRAVADYRVFMQTHQMLSDDDANQFACARSYTALVSYPQESRTHLDLLTEALSLLAENIYDRNGYLRLTEFQNEVLR